MGGFKKTKSYSKLVEHSHEMHDVHLRQLLADNTGRAESFLMSVGQWKYDFSKNIINDATLELLLNLARERGVELARESMFAGDNINSTEGRAALHVALRNPADSHVTTNGKDIMPGIKRTQGQMTSFVEAIYSGVWQGATGKHIKNIVNIGIGGSDLGPYLATSALKYYNGHGLNIRFDANIDPSEFQEAISGFNPDETLFVIVSKSFTTDETMTNARSAKEWIEESLGAEATARHFVAVGANVQGAIEFGINKESVFEFWDWVGGRYSLTSAVGLSIMLAIGPDNFNMFLGGFHEVDEHFRSSPLEENVPVIMALLSVWYTNFLGSSSEAIIPYSHYLKSFPAFVQQLSMESNGKMVTNEGDLVDYATAPVVWGQPGTNAQHSFFQLLHQGTHIIPVDFIGFAKSNNPRSGHQKKLIANLLAQQEALALGLTIEQLKEDGLEDESLYFHKAMPGNRPSSLLLADKLTPQSLGQLIALYEHKTFIQGVIWGVNSFDQWGVQRGKVLASRYETMLEGSDLSVDSILNTKGGQASE